VHLSSIQHKNLTPCRFIAHYSSIEWLGLDKSDVLKANTGAMSTKLLFSGKVMWVIETGIVHVNRSHASFPPTPIGLFSVDTKCCAVI
jgi:hypothetical protein